MNLFIAIIILYTTLLYYKYKIGCAENRHSQSCILQFYIFTHYLVFHCGNLIQRSLQLKRR